MFSIRSIALVLFASLVGASCTFDPERGPNTCDHEGELGEHAVCQNGYWVQLPRGADDVGPPESDVDLGPDVRPNCPPETNDNFCKRLALNCGTVTAPDNCNRPRTADCGECADPEVCGSEIPNVCGCPDEGNDDFCVRLVKSCGDVTGEDRCGIKRTVDCGTCAAPAECGGGGTANVCACREQSDVDFCASYGAECGELAALDECGATRRVDCGGCAGPETCGGGGVTNVCGCVPENDQVFCARNGANCGVLQATDNCGAARAVDCGSCASPEVCGLGARANLCGCADEAATCATLGLECGTANVDALCSNRATVNCGNCTGTGQFCGANRCVCPPENNAAFCARLGAQCGVLSAADNCGAPRSVNCGTCAGTGESCTTGNRCVCPQESDTAFCARHNANCGTVSGTDLCGDARVASCGTCSSGDACGAAGTPNLCGCDDTVANICGSLGRACGSFQATNCPGAPVIDCGQCSNNMACDDTAQCYCPFNASEERTCDDGVDNDCNGAIDCADSVCIGRKCGTGGAKCQSNGSCQ